MQTVRALFPVFNNGQGVCYTCRSVCKQLAGDSLNVEAWFPSSDSHARGSFVRDACPRLLMPLIYRLPAPSRRLATMSERAFLRAMRPSDVAYLWPGVSVETYQRIKDRGNLILTERINCHTKYAKELLDREYRRIGWPAAHGITEQDVETEMKEMELADLIFAPSQLVACSLAGSGVPAQKILQTTYGWDPARVRPAPVAAKKSDVFTVVFVGRLKVRKGVHLLLEAWEKAGINGRLVFAGAIEDDIASHLCAELSRPDVVQLGHTLDIASVFASADVFAFPSLEEGSPLVTYEAMGCGLPVIVSPMGSGPARDGIDGFVLDPHDIDAWANALKQFAADAELRRRMGRSASERAQQFTWSKVGARRREMLLSAITSDALEAVPA